MRANFGTLSAVRFSDNNNPLCILGENTCEQASLFQKANKTSETPRRNANSKR